MDNYFDQEDGEFVVLINGEEQYSLWPAWKDVPGGWHKTDGAGDRQTCLDYIEENWRDMRPKSLREWMTAQQADELK